MLAVGFSIVYSQDIWGTDDLSNYSENEVKFLQILADNEASKQEIRTAIADI